MIQIFFIILEQTALYFPLIIGGYISFSLMKIPDLAIESAFTCGALCATKSILLCTSYGCSSSSTFFMSLIASIVGGMSVGAINTSITYFAKAPHLLSAILTIGIVNGIMQSMGSSFITLTSEQNFLMLLPYIAHYPELLMLLLIMGILIGIMLFFLKTQLGYALAVYGNNPFFFKHYGISSSYILLCGLLIAHGLAGLSGYLCVQASGFFDIHMGFGKALLCITALIIGKTVIEYYKKCSIALPICGALSYFSIQQLLISNGFNVTYFSAVQALVVLFIFACSYKEKQALIPDTLGI